ncbi:MAG: FtsX-like permease family protein [Asgard group archaeon]|nr:FtsX-like permease family protein [Asgard group archaeon]
MVSFYQKLRFYLKVIFMNRKTTILMFIGLGIGLGLVSESLMFMYSFQYDSFTGFTNGIPENQLTVTFTGYDVPSYDGASIPLLDEKMETAITKSEIGNRIIKHDWFISKRVFLVTETIYGYDAIITGIDLIGLPSDYFSTISTILNNGSLPHRIDEAMIVARQAVFDDTNASNLGTFPIFETQLGLSNEAIVDDYDEWRVQFNSSGYITYENFTAFQGASEEDFRAMTEMFPEQFILTSYNNIAHLLTQFNYNPNIGNVAGRVVFDLTQIDAFNIANEIAIINRFSQELSRELQSEGLEFTIDANLIRLLEDFNLEFVVFQLYGLLFISPIIGMAFFLTSYSANLLKRRQKRQVSSMIQRGSSQKEIMFVLLAQILELTITALMIAFVFGYGFTWLTLKSTGFLNFAGTSIYPAINMLIFYVIIIAGFVLSIIINAKNVWDMSKITTHEAYTEHQEQESTWQKLYLDIALLIIGIAIWIIVKTQLHSDSGYAFAYGFGTTAPILIIIGTILLATRLYPIVIDAISKISWKGNRTGLLAIATKRSARRKNDVIKSLVLITLTFTIIFSSMVTINSYKGYDSEVAYYRLGADILVRGVYLKNNNTKITTLGVEGVESATYMTFTSQVITFGPVVYSYLVIGINPSEFAQTAYFEKQYLRGQTAEDFFGAIQDVNDVVMQKDQLEMISPDNVDQIAVIHQNNILGYVNRTLDVVGIFNYFPRFYVEKPQTGATTYRFSIIGNYQNVRDFAYNSFAVAGDLLVKVQDGYDIGDVANEIELQLGRSVDSVAEYMGTNEGSLRNTILYGSLNASFIASMIITIAAVIFMILVQAFENEREVVTLKILGMSPSQLFRVFLTESLIVVTFGAILGILTGISAASMFISILTYQTEIPPTELSFPALQLILASGMLIASAIIASSLTSFIVFRKDTIKAIKQI